MYIVTVVNKGVSIELGYDEEQRLTHMSIHGEITDKFWRWLLETLPTKETMLKNFKAVKGIRVDEKPQDLSFNLFWDEYDLKISNKKRSEDTWKKMSDAERSSALIYLRAYNDYLIKNPGVSKKHADTYLRQQPWSN